ncbi:hypothetical protein SUGI_0786340 [Cryptomeria japonica]|uniref:RING-H2 finger protein ATL2-like n=1 Tax=Cryptomeria japonica TaxID=3369 RepID=UPI0024146CBD|nr:RING-H2 finger protein ATL2-like [Cryptomeria japonica]GLJ38566.1 hypothetical protein SUGI_0786340 [Cryptomeria japonica]
MFIPGGKNPDINVYVSPLNDDSEINSLVGPPNDEGRGDNEWNDYLLMVGVLSLCMLISVIVILYYVYFRMDSHAQHRRRRRSRISRGRRFSLRGGDEHFCSPATQNLCREVVDALPVFVYKPEYFKDGLSCAVCLSEFEENEKARLLPNCNHIFHVECVNMWFYSHSTCPLCRANVEKQSDESVQTGNRAVEISVMEEEVGIDHKAVESSRSGEEQVECIDGESNSVSIDIPTREK